MFSLISPREVRLISSRSVWRCDQTSKPHIITGRSGARHIPSIKLLPSFNRVARVLSRASFLLLRTVGEQSLHTMVVRPDPTIVPGGSDSIPASQSHPSPLVTRTNRPCQSSLCFSFLVSTKSVYSLAFSLCINAPMTLLYIFWVRF